MLMRMARYHWLSRYGCHLPTKDCNYLTVKPPLLIDGHNCTLRRNILVNSKQDHCSEAAARVVLRSSCFLKWVNVREKQFANVKVNQLQMSWKKNFFRDICLRQSRNFLKQRFYTTSKNRCFRLFTANLNKS